MIFKNDFFDKPDLDFFETKFMKFFPSEWLCLDDEFSSDSVNEWWLEFLAADRRQREVGDRLFLFLSISVPINDDVRRKEIKFKTVSKSRFFLSDDFVWG